MWSLRFRSNALWWARFSAWKENKHFLLESFDRYSLANRCRQIIDLTFVQCLIDKWPWNSCSFTHLQTLQYWTKQKCPLGAYSKLLYLRKILGCIVWTSLHFAIGIIVILESRKKQFFCELIGARNYQHFVCCSQPRLWYIFIEVFAIVSSHLRHFQYQYLGRRHSCLPFYGFSWPNKNSIYSDSPKRANSKIVANKNYEFFSICNRDWSVSFFFSYFVCSFGNKIDRLKMVVCVCFN